MQPCASRCEARLVGPGTAGGILRENGRRGLEPHLVAFRIQVVGSAGCPAVVRNDRRMIVRGAFKCKTTAVSRHSGASTAGCKAGTPVALSPASGDPLARFIRRRLCSHDPLVTIEPAALIFQGRTSNASRSRSAMRKPATTTRRCATPSILRAFAAVMEGASVAVVPKAWSSSPYTYCTASG